MACSQTVFLAISVNDETSVSLAFHYARPGSWRRGRGKRLRLHNWRGRGRRRLLFLLFNDRSRLFRLRTRGRATYVGCSDTLHNRSRSRTRDNRSRSRACDNRSRSRSRTRDNRSRSRARNHRSRSRTRDNRSRSRTGLRTRSRTCDRAYLPWAASVVIIICEHAGIESGKPDDKRRERD
jgi:hypothetical protein